MKKVTTMRDSFWDEIFEYAKKDKDIVVISADMGAPALDKFRSELPDQFINIGIAEQNAITVAAGMAMEGKKVFAYAIAPFITLRCFEQIKVTVSTMNIPITIVGVGAGFSYDDSGPTHHTVEDITLLRTLPNMTLHLPSDNFSAKAFARESLAMKSPNYIRLDRMPLEDLYSENTDFGHGYSKLKDGNGLCILATGNMVHQAITIADELNCSVIDLHTISGENIKLLKELEKFARLVTMEEHSLAGGLGSYVLELLADNDMLKPVKRFGADFSQGYCYKYGGRENLQRACGIDTQTISEQISTWV